MSDWAIPQQARLKYTQLFNLHDRVRSGFLSGLQCRDILTQSGLPRNVLAEIWNLSDIDADGQLTREEFVLAMHLTNQARAGQNIPRELPPELVPPSYRKIRTASVTSIQSSTNSSTPGIPICNTEDSEKNIISTTAGSVLNTDSFENKRKENFEKGRAELEKRRLNILEQQAALVRDQLEKKKKDVAEAKAKIDAMRIERDNRMGVITTLEANIQNLQDRKIQLEIEEQKYSFVRKKYRTLFEFESRNPDELTIKPGDIISVIEGNHEPGWLMGELDGKIGLFPESYVEEFTNESKEFIETDFPQRMSPPLETFTPEEVTPQLEIEETKCTYPRKKYRTLFEFESRNPDELTIKPGDIVSIIEGNYEPGWFMGELDGKTGLFPESYVEEVHDESEDKIQSHAEPGQLQRMSSVGSLRSKKSKEKKPEVATVIANYKALGQEQINLEKGQLIAVRRKMDSGWWEGEIQVKGKKKQSGWFPASYVKLLSITPGSNA